MAPLPARLVLVALELFTAFGAFFGGGTLIADPSGNKIGFTPQMLEHTPFSSYLVPGLVLFAVNGLGMLLVALAVLLKWRHSVDASLAMGTLLAGWITVQVLMIGYVSALQPVMFVTGALIVAAALSSRRAVARG